MLKDTQYYCRSCKSWKKDNDYNIKVGYCRNCLRNAQIDEAVVNYDKRGREASRGNLKQPQTI